MKYNLADKQMSAIDYKLIKPYIDDVPRIKRGFKLSIPEKNWNDFLDRFNNLAEHYGVVVLDINLNKKI